MGSFGGGICFDVPLLVADITRFSLSDEKEAAGDGDREPIPLTRPEDCLAEPSTSLSSSSEMVKSPRRDMVDVGRS